MMAFLFLLLTLIVIPSSTLAAPKVKRQNDFWGSWGEWRECSRSCGGGVSIRQRRCYSQRTDGGSSCIGPSRSYRSCNVQNCPEGSRDFRGEQCAEFDGTEFQGKRYKWLPYYGAPNKCELNCIPKGENFYYRHKEFVTDGTTCEPGKHDICVEGICQAVGCDNMLDSFKKEDKCLQCGGDGRACFEVKGLFDVPSLPKGYNQIFIIPMGAMSIHIKEATPTRNFLAIKNVQGTYYLNGHWTINFSQALHIASTVVHYDRGSEGDLAPELLHARGPTTEPLVIELISQEPNQGVHYEYYLPFQRQNSGYSWGYGSWSECSVECGGGYQSRLVFCTFDNEAYPDYMCREKPQPENNRTCGLQSCPQTKRISYQYLPGAWSRSTVRSLQVKRWKTGDWGICSATCGGGTQIRSVYCVSYDGHGSQDVVDDAECASLTESPRSAQPCNMRQCATWTTGPWSECSVSCGEGIQTRTVACRTGLGSQTQDVACLTQPKPPQTQNCIEDNCIHEVGWHIGNWGLCSKSCDSGIRTRQVTCADRDFKSYNQEICKAIQPQIPETFGSCNPQPCHQPQQVPSMQDTTGYDINRLTLMTRYNPDHDATVSRNERVIQDSSTHHHFQPSEGHHGSNFLPLRWESYSSVSRHFNSHSDVAPLAEVHDCSQSPHGCCSDGHTPAAGPLRQGCPPDICHHSRYGCCPDGVSPALGPNKEGCPRYYSDVYMNRNEPPAPSPSASRVLSQQSLTMECRNSMYGCCYDNIASASGPLGEGCLNRPSQPYPINCLLPNTHGPCTDWTTRWYFVYDVGKCNRFWYGGCHGNKNNFASEEECMGTCHVSLGRSDVRPHHHIAIPNIQPSSHLQEGNAQDWQQHSARGVIAQSHTEGAFHIAGDRSEAKLAQHHTERGWGRTMTIDAPPESQQGTAVLESQHRDSHRSAGYGERGMDPAKRLHGLGEGMISEKQLTVNGQTVYHEREEWRRPSGADESTVNGFEHQTPPGPSLQQSLNRILLEGSGPSTVEAGLGQSIRLLCKAGNSPFSRVEWQKDGQPVPSDRHTYQSDSSLVISQLRAEDAGTYMCIISNGRTERRQIQLSIKGIYGPPVAHGTRHQLTHGQNHQHGALGLEVSTGHSHVSTEHPHSMYRLKMYKNEPSVVDANIGERVRLPCRAEATPSLTIEWWKDGQPISSSRHRQQADGALVISRLSAEDAGFFTCIASNGRNQDQRRIQIRPQGELRITGVLPSLSVSEGENTQLQCVVTGNNVNIRWSRNGVPVSTDGHHVRMSHDGSLHINSVQISDEGSYTCNAYSGSNSVSASTEVRVIRKRPEEPAPLPVDPNRECVDQPHLANCELILQAQLCNNEYYSSFCCASCSRYQPRYPPRQSR
ncbi:papilin [Eublepharis macularius]|uniref:Papilin n=1 Tax=Eublepharis macularius TaxID=481883 RepID=A0AA97IWP5_EUBMA|nr:papilin [Eublepharis macularius]XP_054827007.1 papilin [Eublepharis macularius]